MFAFHCFMLGAVELCTKFRKITCSTFDEVLCNYAQIMQCAYHLPRSFI